MLRSDTWICLLHHGCLFCQQKHAHCQADVFFLFLVSQWETLRETWWIILIGILMQYVHGIFTQLAHRLHTPAAKPLQDLGFDLLPVSHSGSFGWLTWYVCCQAMPGGCMLCLVFTACRYTCQYACCMHHCSPRRRFICVICGVQELGPEQDWVTETVFASLFVCFALWTFSPFVVTRPRFFTAALWPRLLCILIGAAGWRWASCGYPASGRLSCCVVSPLSLCVQLVVNGDPVLR